MLKKVILFICSLVLTMTAAEGPIAHTEVTEFGVTIKKIELKKTDGSYYTMFEGNQIVDIASAEPGAVAGSVLEEKVLPDGEYTHVRITVSNSFTVKACEDLGTTANCTAGQQNPGRSGNAWDIAATVANAAPVSVTITPLQTDLVTSDMAFPVTVTNGICSLTNGFSLSFDLSNIFTYGNVGANGCNGGAAACIYLTAAPTITLTAN